MGTVGLIEPHVQVLAAAIACLYNVELRPRQVLALSNVAGVIRTVSAAFSAAMTRSITGGESEGVHEAA